MRLEEIGIYSNQIKKEATIVLKENSIVETLSLYGEVLIVGSYSLDLMYDRDIDIVVEVTDLKNSARNCLNEFIKGEKFSKVEYGDFIKFPRKHRPKGYIINLHIQNDNKIWEIEIWFLDKIDEYKKQLNTLKKLLNDVYKKEILRKKHEKNELGLNKHQKCSYEIYEEVLGKFE